MTPDNPIFFLIAPLWIACVIGASIMFRVTRGKAIIPKLPDNALFKEGWASGRSLTTLWGRFGGARNCLMVAVTPKELIVTPRFPFNLMFLPEIYGLEFSALRLGVRIEDSAAGVFGARVIVVVEGSTPIRMELKLQDKARFLAALAST